MKRLAIIYIAVLLLAARGDDDEPVAAAECEVVNGVDASVTEVAVTPAEYRIEVGTEAVDAGVVTCAPENAGGEPHELVVLEGRPDDLVVEDGEVDERGLVGEIEPFPGGETCEGTFQLAAGTYSLICAIVEEGGMQHSHFEEGMVTQLVVE